MKVQQLIQLRKQANPNANVTVAVDRMIGDYTWDTDNRPITGIMPWPEPIQSARTIELTYD